MSKLTFRADDDLVERVERLEASKSEVVREALRSYLDEVDPPKSHTSRASLDALVEERVDAILEERLGGGGRDVNVTVTVDSPDRAGVEREYGAEDETARVRAEDRTRNTREDREDDVTCGQCGETIDSSHVYCPNCGEKRSRRVFCECGDDLRTDWSFCPGCGRRTPAADVLDSA